MNVKRRERSRTRKLQEIKNQQDKRKKPRWLKRHNLQEEKEKKNIIELDLIYIGIDWEKERNGKFPEEEDAEAED